MDKSQFEQFPSRRIKAVDGMAVTAEVWDEAHDYHRGRQRFHEQWWHGAGIVAGLQVIASDPPDSSVYVLPGVAVDGHGDTIVLDEPVAYDVGAAFGPLYLVLSYDESRPRAGREAEGSPLYIHAQFNLEAVTSLPPGPGIELARFRRVDRGAALLNARDPAHPRLNEVDLRFRAEIVARPPAVASLAVCYAGEGNDGRHGRGAARLARALEMGTEMRACVDDGVSLGAGLEAYSLVLLVGQAAFQLGRDDMNGLYAYLKAGGTVFIESCRRGAASGDPPADACFLDLLASLGIQLQEVPAGHPLLAEPYLFGAPPAGSIDGSGRLLIGEGVVFSTWDYGCLWQGERRGRPAARDDIRAATEWGANLVWYAHSRRDMTHTQPHATSGPGVKG